MSLCIIEVIAWLVVGYLWTQYVTIRPRLKYVVTRVVMIYDVNVCVY